MAKVKERPPQPEPIEPQIEEQEPPELPVPEIEDEPGPTVPSELNILPLRDSVI